MRYLEIDNASGVALNELQTDRAPVAPNGRTCVDVTDIPAAHVGSLFDSNTGLFALPLQLPVRILARRDFIRRFTDTERSAFETLAIKDTADGAVARVAKGILAAGDTVDLDHADTITYLAFLKLKHLLGDTTDADADVRIAAIRA